MLLRACDTCKERKVKCDGSESMPTCSNCRMSNLPCTYLHIPKKRGPKPNSVTRRIRTHRASREVSHEGTGDGDGENMPIVSSSETPLSQHTPYATNGENTTPQWMVSTPPVVTSQRGTNANGSIEAIHQGFVRTLSSIVPNFSLEEMVTKCIDCYMQDLFPLAPIVHEPSLRLNVRLNAPLMTLSAASPYSIGISHDQPNSVEDLARLRSYTLTTAVCASVAFILPPEKVPSSDQVGLLFLRASREMLKLYQDSDIDSPNSSSILIRMNHAGVLHTRGKFSLASQVFGEALALAEQMRLYEERSFEGLDLVEARLRRTAFWQLYIMDKFSAIFEGRPMKLHEFSLDGSLTTNCQDNLDVRLIESGTNQIPAEFEAQLLAGFYLCQKLWATASEVLLDLQTLSRFCRRAESTLVYVEAQRIDLTGSYLQFLSVLDILPSYLHAPETIISANETETNNQRRHFWVQRANLLVTYHCLRIVFLQRFTDLGLASFLGLNGESRMLALRKTEIAHDLISTMTSVPFYSLRANGEACVTKIRRVGATLLEVMQQTDDQQVASRAKSLFILLLDVLAKLDSRASDELNKDYEYSL